MNHSTRIRVFYWLCAVIAVVVTADPYGNPMLSNAGLGLGNGPVVFSRKYAWPRGELPNGTKLKTLSDEPEIFDGHNKTFKIVATNGSIHVIQPYIMKNLTEIYDPYTISDLLGYIFEVQEWGPQGPPSGFTVELFNKATPKHVRRRKRAHKNKSIKAHLVFTKNDHAVEKSFWGKVAEAKWNGAGNEENN